MTNPFPPQTEAERQASDEDYCRSMDEDHEWANTPQDIGFPE